MLTGIAVGGGLRISGPIPYAWVFLVVFLAAILLIFVRVYGGGGRSARQAGHHSRRRNARGTAHNASHTHGAADPHSASHPHGAADPHSANHAHSASDPHIASDARGASHVPERGENHGHRAASRRRQHWP
jgi:hypothetical protein